MWTLFRCWGGAATAVDTVDVCVRIMLKSFRKSPPSSSSSSSNGPIEPQSSSIKNSHLVQLRVVAQHNYTPVNLDTDLTLHKGEEYDVLDSNGVWWMARDKYGQIGLIPFNYVEELDPSAMDHSTSMLTTCSATKLFAYPSSGYETWPEQPKHSWYFPNVDRETSETILRACNRDGCFLIRPSTTEAKCFTLSLLSKKEKHSEVKHYLIQQCVDSGYFYMKPQEMFVSLDKLIKHYRQNRAHLITKLSQTPGRSHLIKSLSENKLAGLSSKDKSWEIKASDLQLLEELGSGQFGVVRHGKWMSKIDVAVKLMKEGTMSEQDFIDEAKVMTKLQHPNLVKLYGLCIEHRPICIVAEFMKHGSLLSFLRKNEHKLLESSHKTYILLNMCIQVCSGMAYLESHNYIHRDLAARNCLVGNCGIVKVADFGLTRYVIDDEYTSSGGTKFPIRWAPPEVLWYTRFSSKSDVWAYGILVWEVFSCGKLPYGKLTNAEVVEKIREGHRLEKPKNCHPKVFAVMQHCWEELPEKRPSFGKLESYLVTLKSRGQLGGH